LDGELEKPHIWDGEFAIIGTEDLEFAIFENGESPHLTCRNEE
jgi:hypothetical protein